MTGYELMILQDQMTDYLLFGIPKKYGFVVSVLVAGYRIEVRANKDKVFPPEMIIDLLNPVIKRRDLLVPPYPKIKQVKPYLWRITLGKHERSQ